MKTKGGQDEAVINRSQALVLGVFAAVVVALVAILAFAPEIYTGVLTPPSGRVIPIEIGFVAALTASVALLGLGVIRRWSWTFWLIVAAFLAGSLRVPASILELTKVLPESGPVWYVLLQGVVGVVQFGIGFALLRGYRKAGVWGAF